MIHSANLINIYQQGVDGCTACMRAKGKCFSGTAMGFGEEVWYTKAGIVGQDKMDVCWHSGVWLGTIERSSESIIGTEDGCIKVRSTMRKPERDRWGGEEWKT